MEQYISGKAKKLVKSCSYSDSTVAYTRAKGLLISEYGSEHKICQAYIAKLNNWPTIRAEDSNAFHDFLIYLMDCLIFIENSRSINPLDTSQEIMKLVAKLPFRMRDAWRRQAHDLMVQRDVVMFADLVQFIERELFILKQPVFGCLSTDVTTTAKQRSGKVKRSLATRVESESQQITVEKAEQTPENYGKIFCEFCKFTNLYIRYCHKFGKLPITERIEFVKKQSCVLVV